MGFWAYDERNNSKSMEFITMIESKMELHAPGITDTKPRFKPSEKGRFSDESVAFCIKTS